MGLFNKRRKKSAQKLYEEAYVKALEEMKKLATEDPSIINHESAPTNVLGLLYFEDGKLYFSSRSAGSRVEPQSADTLIENSGQFVELLRKNMIKSMLRDKASE
jgi:hypothetical protein